MTDRLSILHVADAPRAEASVAAAAVGAYALGLGDDALILAQRLGEWIANAPELEEDVALGNIGLDVLGHARALLTYAGSATDQTEDDLAFFRDENEFRSRWIFELPISDFAFTVCRQLVVSLYFGALYRRLADSSDPVLSAIAAKAVKEVAYHAEHAMLWTRRLGLGTDESHRRMQQAVTDLWPFVGELFAPDPAAAHLAESARGDAESARGGAESARGGALLGTPDALSRTPDALSRTPDALSRTRDALSAVAVAPEELRDEVMSKLEATLRDAGLEVPDVPFLASGGREGRHSETFGHLLAEMQVLARAHPGATW